MGERSHCHGFDSEGCPGCDRPAPSSKAESNKHDRMRADLRKARRDLATARRELGEVRAVLHYASEIIGREHNASNNFEARADRFYRDTGHMAPGKDDPYGGTIEERRDAWTKWNADKVRQFRDALAALKEDKGK